MLKHIPFLNGKLFYSKEGEGKRHILLFHGFGQDHGAFATWVPALKNDYSIYSFDLFFHGESVWPDRNPMEKKGWKDILELFFEEEQIEMFEVAGFSLGGKFALATLEAFPARVKKIVLLAPDGIKTNFWYSLATYPVAVRALFKSMILHPIRFHRIARVLERIGLVDKGLMRFAASQMDTAEKRERVYFSWVYFRHLKFDLGYLAGLVNEYHISFLLMVGKHDKVISSESLNRILDKIDVYEFKILETGHNGVIDASASLLWPVTKS
jgi:pimeloyl-ACP methyl ester carboxylesterase